MSQLPGFGPEPAAASAPATCLLQQRANYVGELFAGRRVVELGCGAGDRSAVLAETAASVVGVDADAPTVQQARETHAQHANLAFVAEDPLTWLQACGADATDAVVWLEGLQSTRGARTTDAVIAELRRLAGAGVAVVVVVPITLQDVGTQGTTTGWSAHEARTMLRQLGDDVTILSQTGIEGAALVGPDGALANAAQVRWPERAEQDYASHLIGCIGAELPAELPVAAQATWSPTYNAYVHGLEQEVLMLERLNTEFTRGAFVASATAAAAPLIKRDALIADLESQNAHLRAEGQELTMRIAQLEAELAARR